jgi:hypothetical protein
MLCCYPGLVNMLKNTFALLIIDQIVISLFLIVTIWLLIHVKEIFWLLMIAIFFLLSFFFLSFFQSRTIVLLFLNNFWCSGFELLLYFWLRELIILYRSWNASIFYCLLTLISSDKYVAKGNHTICFFQTLYLNFNHVCLFSSLVTLSYLYNTVLCLFFRWISNCLMNFIHLSNQFKSKSIFW